MPSLIVSAHLDQFAQAFFDDLRTRHFPSERNFLPAHLTLFHALPSTEVALIQSHLVRMSQRESPMSAIAIRPYSLGYGVAFAIECPRLIVLRTALADLWQPYLTKQDRQPFRPHITVQNKVEAASARELLNELSVGFAPFSLLAEGLDLWTYLGGPWRLDATFPFSSSETITL